MSRKLNILVPNLGSTSLKYQLLDMPSERLLSKGRLERVEDYRQAIARIDTAGAAAAGSASFSTTALLAILANAACTNCIRPGNSTDGKELRETKAETIFAVNSTISEDSEVDVAIG